MSAFLAMCKSNLLLMAAPILPHLAKLGPMIRKIPRAYLMWLNS